MLEWTFLPFIGEIPGDFMIFRGSMSNVTLVEGRVVRLSSNFVSTV
jgi:hypothetical protein